MAKVLLAVLGPTAIGKTSCAITLGKYFKTEIISADSRQFYKEMTIGTAVPTEEELLEVKHHCIQHLSIFDKYTVADFEHECLEILNQLFNTSDVAVLVGGSGLFMDAVLYGLDQFPEVPSAVRAHLIEQLENKGIDVLRRELSVLDPVHYKKVDVNNPHRLIRALEVCIASGKPYSSFLKNRRASRPFKHIVLGISAERDMIYERINQRVDNMLQQGLLEEARKLYPFRELNALQTVGYKELFNYFDGNSSLDEAIEEIKKNTRRFAKRQMTWYRKNTEIVWVDFNISKPKLIAKVEHLLKASIG